MVPGGGPSRERKPSAGPSSWSEYAGGLEGKKKRVGIVEYLGELCRGLAGTQTGGREAGRGHWRRVETERGQLGVRPRHLRGDTQLKETGALKGRRRWAARNRAAFRCAWQQGAVAIDKQCREAIRSFTHSFIKRSLSFHSVKSIGLGSGEGEMDEKESLTSGQSSMAESLALVSDTVLQTP